MDAVGDNAATIVWGANLSISPDLLGDPALWNDVSVLVLQYEVLEAINLAAAWQARAPSIPTVLNGAPCRTCRPSFATWSTSR